jgi:Squalene-hopene cyclase C-terminal domain
VISRAALVTVFLFSAVLAEPALRSSVDDVRESMVKGLDFLLKNQNPDGSWGSHRNAADEFWSNPETHQSWIVATTGLACMTLQNSAQTQPVRDAYDRGVDYLLDHALVKRPSDWDTDNTWAYIYGLQAVARAYAYPRYEGSPRREKLGTLAEALLAKLSAYQTPSGGWGYYDFQVKHRRPAWATSFMTAAGILAMADATDAGLEVDPKMFRAAVKAVKRCRLPSGAFTYSVNAIPSPRHSEWIDQIKGSLSRIQVCNLALLRAGEKISQQDLRTGLDHFFGEHRFLDIARKKPIPHEAYYYNSGYFYFFGHYYAAEVIDQLPRDDQKRYWPMLQHEIVKTREKDGSMWDFYISSYHKPYGTAYGLMALQRSVAPEMSDRPLE